MVDTPAPTMVLATFMTCWMSTAFAQSPPTGDARTGEALALKICTPCHIVASNQDVRPIFNGPPKPLGFAAIANKTGTSADLLRVFLSTTHSTATMPLHMPNPSLTDDQMSRIISFILTLRKRR